MAQSHSGPAPAQPDSMDVMERRRGWQGFLKLAKWSALGVFGATFFLILVLIGHMPWLPTLIVMALLVFAAGSLFH